MPRPAVLAVAFLMALVASGRPALAATAHVTRPHAELREKTGFAGAVVATPEPGTTVEVVEHENAWVHVRLAGGAEGWIHEAFLAPGAGTRTPDVHVAAPRPASAERPAPPPHVAVGDEPPAAGAEPPSSAEAVGPSAGVDSASAPPGPALSPDMDPALMRSELIRLRVQDEYLTTKLASLTTSEEDLRGRVAEVAEERDQARRDLAAARAALPPGAAAALDAAREEGRLAAKAENDTALRARDELSRKALAESDAHHQATVEKFIAMVTKKHDDALARETAAIQADCERRLVDERRDHEKELAIVRKDSGWESEMEKQVRARLDTEIEEAKSRWEAKQRGEMYDAERARREEGERVRKICEAERLVAVNAALAHERAGTASALEVERQEADLRCQVALELVLEGAAEGADMKKVRGLADSASRRRSGDAPAATGTEAQPAGQGAGTSEAAPQGPAPPRPQPLPTPLPWMNGPKP